MISKRVVTNAVATLLSSASGKPVGRGHMPADSPRSYYLLYTLDTTVGGAPLADMSEDLTITYQVTSVSGPLAAGKAGSQEESEAMADTARTAFLGRDPVTGLWLHPLDIPGAVVMCRDLDVEPGGSNDPGDAIMSYVQRFRLELTPA